MDLSTWLVDLDSIEIVPDVIDNFTPDKHQIEIEHLAHSIVKTRGLITLPVVKRIGIESYQLITGHLAYYATLKAREFDSEIPDRMRVFIIDQENLQLVLEQFEALNNIATVKTGTNPNTDKLQLDNILALLKKMHANIPQIKQTNEQILETIKSKIPQPLPLLEACNQILSESVYRKVLSNLAFLGPKKAKKIADRIKEIKGENPDLEFESITQLMQAMGKGYISAAKMLEAVDQWK